ncbi:hypothetical protein FLK61_24345 [Paenalkalicoccus suaedae]|uniref:Phage capsid protein n=1 Tax=Paenalkalicoccus suaedae TaxID=2592382 RepID=A0A859FCC3_9BACI|nr:DUF6366 family protein [Paenalkalicoccus suaedae]QKS69915.1 hypothetical protein FLK61_24345 [Paenalkalicoccus suaedae]
MTTPQEKREKLRRDEQQKNTLGNAKDAFDRSQTGSAPEFTNGFSWLGLLITIVSLIGFYLLYVTFFG